MYKFVKYFYDKGNYVLSVITRLFECIINWCSKNVTRLVIIQFVYTFDTTFMSKNVLQTLEFFNSNIIGYSLFTNFMVLGFVWNKPFKYCEIVRAMLISMIFSNIITMATIETSYEFFSLYYDRIVMGCFAGVLRLYLKKKHGYCCK